jgi:hypothetical protein
MNNQLINDFMQKTKHTTVEDLGKEVIASKIATKSAIEKIKLIRINLTHLHLNIDEIVIFSLHLA